MTPITALVYYTFVAINMYAFWLYARDKRASLGGGGNGPRISEARLIAVAVCGGFIGAEIARLWYEHKTTKRSFLTKYYGALCVECTVLAVVVCMLPRYI